MGNLNLDGIVRTSLNVYPTDGGCVRRIIRHDDIGFDGFKEAYFSSVQPNIVRGWKLHTKMTLNLVVPVGLVKFVFTADLHGSEFRTEIIGENDYCRLTVPPNIWFAFMGLSNKESLVLNIANYVHEPSEVLRINIQKINFDW